MGTLPILLPHQRLLHGSKHPALVGNMEVHHHMGSHHPHRRMRSHHPHRPMPMLILPNLRGASKVPLTHLRLVMVAHLRLVMVAIPLMASLLMDLLTRSPLFRLILTRR